ncbi:MAG TPA: hypothetical protein VMC09_12030 [Anaerolineales bacterium]|nr:hypothetical protein [Anaerolineales bacterium]
METEQGIFPPPPGLFASLARGFDSVATHIAVILPPVLLDVFLWLGPRLSLKSFIEPLLNQIVAAVPASNQALDPAQVQQQIGAFANNFNLFRTLFTFPVGLSGLWSLPLLTSGNSLMEAFENPTGSPLAGVGVLNAGSFFGIAGWIILLAMAGWVIGGIYYYWVSAVAVRPAAPAFLKSVTQSVLLSIIWAGVLFVIGIPVLTLIGSIAIFSPFLGNLLIILAGITLIWLILPIFFSAHGIFTLQLDAFRAILKSLRMVRFTLPNTGMFLLVFLVINQGLSFLWNVPPQNSWWTLVGITGHAFVSTALLAASFIYYRDINAWLAVVFEQLKKQANPTKV